MIEPPGIFLTEPRHYAGLHQVIPVAQIQKVMGPSIQEVLAAVKAQSLEPAGPVFTHHLHRPVKTFDFEVGVPVAEAIAPDGRVLPRIWPRMKVARTIFHGNYSGLPGAWGEFEKWVNNNSRHPGTEFWEVYTIGPETDPNPEAWRTELNWPLMD